MLYCIMYEFRMSKSVVPEKMQKLTRTIGNFRMLLPFVEMVCRG